MDVAVSFLDALPTSDVVPGYDLTDSGTSRRI
jgi:hypothetical protein